MKHFDLLVQEDELARLCYRLFDLRNESFPPKQVARERLRQSPGTTDGSDRQHEIGFHSGTVFTCDRLIDLLQDALEDEPAHIAHEFAVDRGLDSPIDMPSEQEQKQNEKEEGEEKKE
ncbi:MAG: hypothetical protein ABEI86_12025 [Halobacteriaceae archaeon]